MAEAKLAPSARRWPGEWRRPVEESVTPVGPAGCGASGARKRVESGAVRFGQVPSAPLPLSGAGLAARSGVEERRLAVEAPSRREGGPVGDAEAEDLQVLYVRVVATQPSQDIRNGAWAGRGFNMAGTLQQLAGVARGAVRGPGVLCELRVDRAALKALRAGCHEYDAPERRRFEPSGAAPVAEGAVYAGAGRTPATAFGGDFVGVKTELLQQHTGLARLIQGLTRRIESSTAEGHGRIVRGA